MSPITASGSMPGNASAANRPADEVAAQYLTFTLGEEVFAMEVLSFLTVRDLSAFSVCSKYFYEMANDGYLWQSLVARDFLINPKQEVVCLDDHHIQDSKELYVAQYQSLHKKNELFSHYRLAIAKRQMRRKETEGC